MTNKTRAKAITLMALLSLASCGYPTEETGQGIDPNSPAGQAILSGFISGAFQPQPLIQPQPSEPVHVIIDPDGASNIPLGPWSR